MSPYAEQRFEAPESTQGLKRMEHELTVADDKLKQLDEQIREAERKSKNVLDPEP